METMRNFIRCFPRYKRQAEAGKTVRVVDRQGRRFRFEIEKAPRCTGAAKDLAAGQPLGPDPVPFDEWKGTY